ncbi:hypothetical protein A1O1_08720 [Capronia coronata CBS 617.96]|uniref:Zn(2)-C6 fungal-type domain-containing protein n=1 Tax=Capronia coronata CBS 617.96 TaxID=1182541 RepID=W9YE37_9EURO|nr:uncharacterized protein A1O1_08720 [Capronia coronata CBS 617.96]EXJ80574.1 hypothetical protein A1O1_08720 [Capronia coronata CBS 617.96]
MTTMPTPHGGDASRKPARTRDRKPRGRGLRTRTGCMTCRKRHLKCNEEKPVCGPCARSNHDCVYADPSSIQAATPYNPTSHPAPSLAEQPQSEHHLSQPASPDFYDTATPLACYSSNAGADNHSQMTTVLAGWDENSSSQQDSPRSKAPPVSVTGELSPGAPYLQSLMQTSISSQSIYAVSSPEDIPTACHISKSGPLADAAIAKWFGLLAGDAEFEGEPAPVSFNGRPHVQPDTRTSSLSELANAQSHLRAEFPSSISGPALGAARTASHRIPYSHPVPPDSHLWQSTAALTLRPHETKIFNHFVNRISRWIDLFDPIRHFSTYVPHLAMHNVGLLNAILALSVRHLSLSPTSENGAVHDRNESLPYYHETLHYVQKAMQYDSYNTSAELLATCLIISAYEMLDGSRKDWERHLQGVFWIQRAQRIDGDSFGLHRAVWWAWLCQDVWAAFKEKRKPFNSWTPSRDYGELNSYEIAARSVYVLAQVVAYCSQEEMARGEVDIRPRIDRAETLGHMLDDWQRHLPIEFNPLPLESGGSAVFKPIWVHPPAFGVAIQVHCAARILLLMHRPFLRGLADLVHQQREIGTYIETICGLAVSTASDYASSSMTSQCLFIAGLCVRDLRQRTALVELLDLCHRSSGWPIQSLSKELYMVWNGFQKHPFP